MSCTGGGVWVVPTVHVTGLLTWKKIMAVSTLSFAHLESLVPPGEQAILELLKKIEGIASDAELEQALYEFRGLLPSLEPPRKIVDSYLALRQSNYCQTALSLVLFIVQFVQACLPNWTEEIKEFIRKNTMYESDLCIPSLMLRLTLATITNQLSGQADNFIRLASEHLQLHPDEFEGGKIPVLKVFEMLEEKCLLDPKDKHLKLASKWLEEVERHDLVEDHIANYNPYRPISLAVLKEMNSKLALIIIIKGLSSRRRRREGM